MGMEIKAMSVSRDNRWIVCGTTKGASVWDGEMREKAIEVESIETVVAVDISPDSTRFATCTGVSDNKATIWDILTGERLVGPLLHLGEITGVAFSPTGEQIATAGGQYQCIRIFDSRNGDQLITIGSLIEPPYEYSPSSSVAWSKDGKQIFAQSYYISQIMIFDTSTGSLLAKTLSQKNDVHDFVSITLAANGKFFAVSAEPCISFLDASTLTQIGPVGIEDTENAKSIALSPDCSYLATGSIFGSITIRNLSDILPESYGPFHVSIHAFTVLACRFTP